MSHTSLQVLEAGDNLHWLCLGQILSPYRTLRLISKYMNLIYYNNLMFIVHKLGSNILSPAWRFGKVTEYLTKAQPRSNILTNT